MRNLLKGRSYSRSSAVTAGIAWNIFIFFALAAYFVLSGNELAHRSPDSLKVYILMGIAFLSYPLSLLAVGLALAAIVRKEGMSDDLAMGLIFGLLLFALESYRFYMGSLLRCITYTLRGQVCGFYDEQKIRHSGMDCRNPDCTDSSKLTIHGTGYPLPGGYDDI